MVKIAVSLHSGPKLHLSKTLDLLKSAKADYLHIDVMDGSFVPEIDFGASLTHEIAQYSNIPLDIHMMVNNPIRLIKHYDFPTTNSIGIHVEATQQIHRDLYFIKQLNKKAEVSINPGTPITALYPILDLVDQIMVMSVDPGCSGKSPFISEVSTRIKELNQLRIDNDYNYQIEVDGGITEQNLSPLIDDGLDTAVSGSFVFQGNNIKGQIQKLKNCDHI
ncbi:ribulose-phosphate 3-epimerase [Lactobacillus gasseri]|jgi:ribulose-phosphate 3-epimerase|uniref:Ribulose-phosphate 3-epimerase n=1 Tax=Lactobacillus gasseri TaxID=1596 RepID=A0ABY3BCZ0_LACGS|nr:ribulose-phosphate 3-epimerase [Lactobacillus gasseri]EEQ26023.1 putative ribulose-phosphate 3-epimerase [Lactobacillus gasseri 202-4]MCZ3932975.1 ribulose-phosphate 3-epimerase [Lactobacillus gasseri]MCZ3934608.1 ribulose-phosphate 3-epimerase [Lactobacillus gasseri]MCZ3936532.1 ribulose-phosphate 3-epimerase [Lactobacillus gasseri]MCZ3943847.1 ribulose-phosphate 3-epimerase [Lactobacillus gasseri]